MKSVETKTHIYTVTELTRYIRMVLEETFARVWVEGEISNFTKHSSGHMYFSLKDENSVVSSVMFRNVNQNLKFKVEAGIKVICYGRISVYDKRGQYQLYVDKIEPKGLGALQLAFEQLKERLKKEGFFDAAHKKEIPYLPRRIGVVTSPTGAAIRDILNVTRHRFQNVDVVLNPVRVQGKGSEDEIARAIEELNEFEDVDVIIIGRGGGSLEDLWAFNEEVVARAIYNSRIPIISAVGHEVDTTISDFVADLRAPTPSAAAERVIPRKEDLRGNINSALLRLKNALTGLVSMREEQLRHLRDSYVFKQPFNLIDQYTQRADDLLKGLALGMGHIIELNESSFRNAMGQLNSLSPFAVLKRGYGITTNASGEVIKDVNLINVGERIKTRLSNGTVISKVEKTEEGDSNG